MRQLVIDKDILDIMQQLLRHQPLSEQQEQRLSNWRQRSPDHESIINTITDDPSVLQHLRSRLAVNTSEAWDKVAARIESAPTVKPVTKPGMVFMNSTWFRVAAAVLVIFGISIFLWNRLKSHSSEIASVAVPANNTISPGFDRATLTLSDGRTIDLDKASDTIKDGALSIANNHGELAYSQANISAMNTMTTPKGGQYRLTLADGTRIWMNAESSITFPTAFLDKSREVHVAGEVYFEVSRNKEKPFIVSTDNEKILVLGTSFNVNTYDNDRSTKTSLIDGSIKISNTILEPGQAFVNNKVVATNIEQDIAWKNGEFNFDHLTTQQVMRQIARWYNIDIQYQGGIPDIEFRGNMGRNLTLHQVLESLELMGMRFTLTNRVLTVAKK